MNLRRSQSVSRTSPQFASTTNLLFENPSDGVQPITLAPSDVTKEVDNLLNSIRKEVDWDKQVAAMQRGMSLVKGGALKNEFFKKSLTSISPGLVSAAINARSSLVKTSCLFIAQLAPEYGTNFDFFGEIISPISSQLQNGTQIIADCVRYAIFAIVKNVPTRRTLCSIQDLSKNRGTNQRNAAAEAITIILSQWPVDFINSNVTKIELLIKQFLSDASPVARTFARQSIKVYEKLQPQRASEIISRLDPRTKKAISDELPLASTTRLQTTQRKSTAPNSPTRKSQIPRSKNPIERAHSPAPRSPKSLQKPVKILKLTEGAERSYIEKVQAASDEVIEANIKYIQNDLVKCCQVNQVAGTAFSLILGFLPQYALAFKPNLPNLFTTALDQAEKCQIPKVSSAALQLLQALPSFFQPLSIVALTVDEKPSSLLVQYLWKVFSEVDQVDNDSLLGRILSFLENVTFSNIKIQHVVGHIVEKIFSMKPQIVDSFLSSRPDFAATVKPYLDIESSDEEIEVPRFSLRNTAQWRRKIEEISSRAKDWSAIREVVYEELSAAFESGVEIDQFLSLTQFLLNKHGNDDFRIFLPSLLLHAGRKMDSLMLSIVRTSKPSEVLEPFQPLVLSDSKNLVRKAVDMEERIIATMEKDDVKRVVDLVIPALTKQLDNEAAEVRKACVSCFAEMFCVLGTEVMKGKIDNLTKVQKRLIMIFYNKRMSE